MRAIKGAANFEYKAADRKTASDEENKFFGEPLHQEGSRRLIEFSNRASREPGNYTGRSNLPRPVCCYFQIEDLFLELMSRRNALWRQIQPEGIIVQRRISELRHVHRVGGPVNEQR